MTGLTARYKHIAGTPAGPLIAVVFGGTYAPGSEGNEFAREMVNYLCSTLTDVHPAGVLFDLTALDYVWGDAIGGLAIPLMGKGRLFHFLPSVMVAAGPTALALKPLLEPRWLLGLAGMKLFGTREEALAYLEKNVHREQRTWEGVPAFLEKNVHREQRTWEGVPAFLEKSVHREQRIRAQQERSMAKRGFNAWPVVEATLRSATFPSEGLGPGLGAALHYLQPLGIIWGLVELVRGHRACFLYTYIAGGQYRVGYANRYVRGTSDTPRLFGRAPEETIQVHYNPEKPEVSVVLAWDNPGR